MEKLTKEQREKIIKNLQERGAKLPCPRCGQKNFTLLDGYFVQSVTTNIGAGVVLGGPVIPSVVVVCQNCGYLSQHALGAIGLLPEEEIKNEK